MALTSTQAAQLLITADKLDDARKILLNDLKAKPEDSETLFLLADIAAAQKDYDAAISYYRHILVNEPDAERVRLELARVFFLKGDYDNADRQFRFARAGNVEDAVKANIDRFLSAINRLREWTFNFSFALAPDTNENAATNLSLVSIYGLPFELTPDARRKSGVGAAGEIGGEWSPPISDNLKARIGADIYRLDYSGSQFDDMTISSYAGPQWLFADGDISVLASGFQRWYGNRLYANGVGGKLAGDYGITSDLLIGASVGAQSIFYRGFSAQNGPLVSVQAQATYVLSPSSLFQLQSGFNRQQTEQTPYSYSGYWFGVGYSQDLPLGFSAGFQPTYYVTDYDAPLLAFGATRHDHAMSLSFNLLNRRLDYNGLTPRFSYTYTNQQSSIPLYRYSRNQFQIGITSQF